MKKIGILFGEETEFPQAFVERINKTKQLKLSAEYVNVNKIITEDKSNYSVIIDRVSDLIPFYQAFLKHQVLKGTSVINNPFLLSTIDQFSNLTLASKLQIPVPKTVILPSKVRPEGTNENSFTNLDFPLDWEGIFTYIGFPAQLKLNRNNPVHNFIYELENIEDFFRAYADSKENVMILQSKVVLQNFYRFYCIDKNVSVLKFDPNEPNNVNYVQDSGKTEKKLITKMEKYALSFNETLGLNINIIEFGVNNDTIYATNLFNPVPKIDINSVGERLFEWFVDNSVNLAVNRAKKVKLNT
jgi:hypothetical protein